MNTFITFGVVVLTGFKMVLNLFRISDVSQTLIGGVN